MDSARFRPWLRACVLLLLIITTLGQDTSPSNDTSSISGNVQFTMDTLINNMGVHVAVEPLTNEAGLSGSLSQLQAIQPSGPLFLTTSQTVNDVSSGYICFISCEPSDYEPGNIGSSKNINIARDGKPSAIVLYSTVAASCTFSPTNNFDYVSMYTMLDANSSLAVVDGLKAGNPMNPATTIHVNQTTVNGTSTSNGNILGKSPTTAVAMIILYSITGIITALFLIIIIVGAIRAHRHPERYGPRHVIGRPRQSRAKGIARAMLETLPIVKFGDKEDDKPTQPTRDIELESATAQHRESVPTGSEQPKDEDAIPDSTGVVGDGPDVVKTEAAAVPAPTTVTRQESANPVDDGLACSVCTDDFIRGQDIRVLPCKHKFHPECIDPWLLNVSGTCPLCRIDLHPTRSHDSDEDNHVPSLEPRHAEPPPDAEAANIETSRRNRRSRILSTLNIGRMRQATPQERLEALRVLRNEGMTGADPPEQGQRTPNRFSRRLSRALGSRPTSGVPSSRPTSEIPPGATDTDFSSNTEQRNTEGGVGSRLRPEVDRRRQGTYAG